jgi:hypothetical protein
MHPGKPETKDPLVSVVIPAYNAARFIVATLDSVLAQTFKDFEIIVVNDGSPDSEELERVLEPSRSRIIYLRQENQGVSVARNTGIRESRGKFIAPLDADDLWEPEHLAAQLEAFHADPSIDMIYADARIFGDVPEAGRTVMEFNPSSGEVTLERLVARQCTVHHCVCLIRKEILLRAGLYDPAFRRAEDIDLWLRIVLHGGRICYQKRVLGQYRRSGGSLSSTPIPMLESFLGVLAKTATAPNLSATQRAVIEQQILVERATLEVEKAKCAVIAGDAETAISHLSNANTQRKSSKIAMILLLLRVAPGFLRTLYLWRNRPVHNLTARR